MWEWNRVALPATRAQNGAAGRPSEDHRPVGAGANRGRRMCVANDDDSYTGGHGVVTAGNLQAWRDGACSRLDRKTPEKDPKRDCGGLVRKGPGALGCRLRLTCGRLGQGQSPFTTGCEKKVMVGERGGDEEKGRQQSGSS